MKKKAKLIERTHFFMRDEYECSACGYRATRPFKTCPRCGSSIRGGKSDSGWVDDLEAFDALFGDD